jgi:hypothetical protein
LKASAAARVIAFTSAGRNRGHPYGDVAAVRVGAAAIVDFLAAGLERGTKS